MFQVRDKTCGKGLYSGISFRFGNEPKSEWINSEIYGRKNVFMFELQKRCPAGHQQDEKNHMPLLRIQDTEKEKDAHDQKG